MSSIEFNNVNLTPEEVEQVIMLRNKIKHTHSVSHAQALKERIDKILAGGTRRHLEEQLETMESN